MTGGQATLDSLTFEEDEETRETPVGDEEEQGDLSPPTDDDLREDADTDETEGATDEGEVQNDDADENVRRPEEIREGDDADDSGFSSSGAGGGTTTCPSCGAASSKCYRCSECGKDLVGVTGGST